MSTNSTPTHAGAARQLPIVTINGKRYYRDDRLREYRAVNNPHDRLPLIETRAPAATLDADHRRGTVKGPTTSPMADETITNGVRDAWICVCGNNPRSDGFYACDTDGNEVEPVEGWSGLYVCAACGRIIDPDTLRVIGRNPGPKMLE